MSLAQPFRHLAQALTHTDDGGTETTIYGHIRPARTEDLQGGDAQVVAVLVAVADDLAALGVALERYDRIHDGRRSYTVAAPPTYPRFGEGPAMVHAGLEG